MNNAILILAFDSVYKPCGVIGVAFGFAVLCVLGYIIFDHIKSED